MRKSYKAKPDEKKNVYTHFILDDNPAYPTHKKYILLGSSWHDVTQF